MFNLANSESNITEAKRYPTILAASIIYFLVLIFMMLSSFFISGTDTGASYYYTMIVVQLAAIGAPPLIYCVAKGINIKKTARFNKLSISEFFLITGLSVSGYFAIMPLTLLWQWFLRLFGTPQLPELPAMDTGVNYLLGIVTIAVIPALIEEFMFRGIILRGYENMGIKKAIILTGVFFGLLHMNLANMPIYIILGILLCYVVYRTNSIWAGIVYHLINNTIAVTLQYVFNAISKSGLFDDASGAAVEAASKGEIASFIFLGFVFLFFIIIFIGCLIGLNAVTKSKIKTVLNKVDESAGMRFVQLLPAIGATVLLIANLVMEFWMLV